MSARTGGEDIDGFDAERHLLVDTGARLGIRRNGFDEARLPALLKRAETVERLGEGIDDAAEPAIGRADGVDAEGEVDRRARPKPIERIAGKKNGAVAFKADQFAARACFASETDGGAQAQGLLRAGGLDAETFKRGDPALVMDGFKNLYIADRRGQHG